MGKFSYDKEFSKNANNFYDRFSDDYEVIESVNLEKWEEFEKYILTLNEKDLY